MRRLVIIIIVLVLVGVGVCVGGSLLAPKLIKKPGATPTQVEASAAAAGSVVRAQGKLVPARVEMLSFGTSGTVSQVSVEVGDEVTVGQVLARLDTTDLEWAVRQTEDALASARLTYSQTVKIASPEDIASAEATLSSAEAGLVSAQAGLVSARIALTNAISARDALTDTRTAAEASLKSARASLTSAQASLAALEAGPDANAVEQARLHWEQAKNSLWHIQLERDALHGRPGIPDYVQSQMKATVANAEIAARLAEISYLQVQEGASEEALAAARASVTAAEVGVLNTQAQVDDVDRQTTQAEASVAQAEAAVTQAEAGVSQAEAAVEQAQVALDRLRAGPDELAVAQAALSVRQAEAELERAKARLLDVECRASLDGTISTVAVEEGAPVVAGAPAVTVADLSAWKVETEDLDEWGVTHIATDTAVNLIFTAFDDKTLTGRIEEIDLNLTLLPTGDVAYKVTIVLDEFDPELRWGMSVRVEFEKLEDE